VAFAPGEGPNIDHQIAGLIGRARRRLKVCSMLITSGTILGALNDVRHRGGVAEYGGVYDRTQMEGVFEQWRGQPAEWKIAAFEQAAAGLAGKHSTPYAPDSPHDFMHNKVLVADDTVVTGSYNLSHSATENAENVLMLHDRELADRYAAYIDELVVRYRET
jgi:phosphatidylserine/phosphatidylglycerophosphate/cardiolipin synthase-like enzyme